MFIALHQQHARRLARCARLVVLLYAAILLVTAAAGSGAAARTHLLGDAQELLVLGHADAPDAAAKTGGKPAAVHEVLYSLKLDSPRLDISPADLPLDALLPLLILLLPGLLQAHDAHRPPGSRFPLRNHRAALITSLRLQV